MKKKIFLKRTGITIAVGDPVTIADDGWGDWGMGVRKHGDHFSAVTGAKMALKSLLNRHYNHNKPYKELAWEEFFAHPWVVRQKELEAERESALSQIAKTAFSIGDDLEKLVAAVKLNRKKYS